MSDSESDCYKMSDFELDEYDFHYNKTYEDDDNAFYYSEPENPDYGEISEDDDAFYYLEKDEIFLLKQYGRYGRELIDLRREYKHMERYDRQGSYGWDDDYSSEVDKAIDEAYDRFNKLESYASKIQAINTIDKKTEKKLDKFLILDILKMANL